MDNGHGVVKSVFFSFNQLVPTSIKTNTPSDHKTTTAWPRPHCSVPIFSSSARLVHSFIFMYFFLIYCMLFKVMCAQKNDIKERFSTKNMMLAGIACFFCIHEHKRNEKSPGSITQIQMRLGHTRGGRDSKYQNDVFWCLVFITRCARRSWWKWAAVRKWICKKKMTPLTELF